VFESIALASRAGLRVSLNVLTHPGVTDDRAELDAARAFLRDVRVDMLQTRTLNIDPAIYFARVGRPREPVGMRAALTELGASVARIGNFTHAH
jgi:pyruvate-formate lyase-activating enzyme